MSTRFMSIASRMSANPKPFFSDRRQLTVSICQNSRKAVDCLLVFGMAFPEEKGIMLY